MKYKTKFKLQQKILFLLNDKELFEGTIVGISLARNDLPYYPHEYCCDVSYDINYTKITSGSILNLYADNISEKNVFKDIKEASKNLKVINILLKNKKV